MQNWLKKTDNNLERWLCLVFYAMIAITIVSEVMRRFLLSYSSIWGEEVARYCFIYLAWIGAALAVKERSHIRIDVIMNFLSSRNQILLYIFSDILTLMLSVICLVVSVLPVLTSIEFGSVTHGLRISQFWFLMAVPIGFSLILVRLLQSLKRDIADLRAGREPFKGTQLVD
ncbi:TRAP transporter permease DctQ [Veronia nyctiphanis]|uniref:TRAP transporter small permease protein n=1 Tax=Veronia nyctiphanis TaxID=1278244 RepID=A0A4V1LSU0_9GAMM|nr:TRAP transporter small permease [Veronia nyctiphanis]RXJ72868.1 TRAP transporter permease DctQ [Veronia nyctiphanis]